MVSPVLVPVWIAGLLAPFRRWRCATSVSFRSPTPSWARPTSSGTARPTTSQASIRCCSGSARYRPRSGRRARLDGRGFWLRPSSLSIGVSAIIALPLLPATSLQGSAVMKLNPDQGETVGWPRFVDTVLRAWQRIPRGAASAHRDLHPELRRSRCDRPARAPASPRLQRAQRIQRMGQPPPADTYALITGYDGPADAAPDFQCLPYACDHRRRRRPRQRRAGPAGDALPNRCAVVDALARAQTLRLTSVSARPAPGWVRIGRTVHDAARVDPGLDRHVEVVSRAQPPFRTSSVTLVGA